MAVKLRRSLCGSLLWLIAAGGCGDADQGRPGTTPSEICDRIAIAACSKIYECSDAAQRAALGLPESQTDCTFGVSDRIQCTRASAQKICAGAKSFSAAQAERCIVEASNATCAMVQNNSTNISAYAPSCGPCAGL